MYATKEELEILCDAIYGIYLLDLMQTYIRRAQADTSPLRQLFIDTVQALMDAIHADLVATKKKLKAAGIRYVELEANKNNALQFQLFFRGFEERFSLTRENAKAEMQIRLSEYEKKAARQLLRIGLK